MFLELKTEVILNACAKILAVFPLDTKYHNVYTELQTGFIQESAEICQHSSNYLPCVLLSS